MSRISTVDKNLAKTLAENESVSPPITTVSSFLIRPSSSLTDALRCSETKIDHEIKRAVATKAIHLLSGPPKQTDAAKFDAPTFPSSVTLASFLNPTETNFSFPSGTSSLQFSSHKVYEIAGCSGIGKTQFALTTAAIHAERGGRVLYICCGGSSSSCVLAERLQEILTERLKKSQSRPNSPKSALDRVSFYSSNDVHQLIQTFASLRQYEEEEFPLLVVLDSAGGLLSRTIRMSARMDENSAANSRMEEFSLQIRRLVREAWCTVLVLNNVTRSGKPALGQRIWARTHDYRILLNFGDSDLMLRRGAILARGRKKSSGDFEFVIQSSGVK